RRLTGAAAGFDPIARARDRLDDVALDQVGRRLPARVLECREGGFEGGNNGSETDLRIGERGTAVQCHQPSRLVVKAPRQLAEEGTPELRRRVAGGRRILADGLLRRSRR